jgi:type I restriction enzyme S subunit
MNAGRVAIDFAAEDLPSTWKTALVSECLSNQRFHVGKVKREDYGSSGAVPIIDQGQSFIAGYTDRTSDVYDGPLPVIVFGDHTRVFKLIDFPFVCGADGTKVLLPSEAFDPAFMYFALLSLSLPSRGYNRHFGMLREKLLPMPPIAEQRGIAFVLRTVQLGRQATERVIAAAGELRRSMMSHLFTYGAVSVVAAPFVELAQDEAGTHPNHWASGTIDDLGKVVTGATPSTAHTEYFGGPYPFFTPSEVNGSKWLAVASRTLTEEGLARVRELPEGAILVTCIGEIGRVGISQVARSASNQQINAIVPSGTDPEFLYYLMEWSAPRIKAKARSTTVSIVSKGNFKSVQLALPPDQEQSEMTSALTAVDGKILAEEGRRDALDQLLKSLLHELMTGRRRTRDIGVEVAG